MLLGLRGFTLPAVSGSCENAFLDRLRGASFHGVLTGALRWNLCRGEMLGAPPGDRRAPSTARVVWSGLDGLRRCPKALRRRAHQGARSGPLVAERGGYSAPWLKISCFVELGEARLAGPAEHRPDTEALGTIRDDQRGGSRAGNLLVAGNGIRAHTLDVVRTNHGRLRGARGTSEPAAYPPGT